ncbi:unnamed protein product [Mytilus edulis]|uniref:Uncharacterized protein n=1 Tax=Mytilus edulis TaxID=6550 RepID=A0A8S3SCI8_MYTED|nr:unnamed protein product [Mytilus edulis]
MTSRKFYGSHFHSLVVHFPEMYRIFCLRSLIPEAEERTFGDLRNISLRTTNRQAKYIVDNCMLRLKAREKIDDDDRLDSFKRQESIISKQAHLLPQRGNTIIPAQLVTTRSTLIQAHYERISDFLVCGKHVWWQVNDGNIEFLDGPDEEEYHSSGPTLHHFSTSNLKTEYEHLNINWEKCVNKISEGNFQLPCVKVKIYKEGQLSKVVNTDLDLEEETESYEETIPSNISNGSEGSTPQDIEKQHDVNPVLNINGNPSVEKTSNHDKPPDTNTIPISKNNSDPSTELMPLDRINQPHEVIQTLPIPFSSDNRCYTDDMIEFT